MGLQFIPAPKIAGTHDNYVRAHYNEIKQRWYAKYGKEEHPIEMSSLEISGAKILYSLPCNSEHPAWTKREVTTIENPFIVARMWSVLCEGVAIVGKPIIKDGTFKLTTIFHDNIKRKEYEE